MTKALRQAQGERKGKTVRAESPSVRAEPVEALSTRLAAAGIHSLLVQFADVHGTAKGKLVPLAQLPEMLATGAGFAGPSIWGTGLPRTGPRSEYYARGDAATAQPLPWLPGVARLVGDGFVDGQAFEACPRQVLHRALARLKAAGLTMQLGIEPEFFLLKRDPAGRIVPADDADRLAKPSYDLASLQRPIALLHELQHTLQACGFEVQQIDHEDAHGQYELNWRHADALTSCDRLMLFKLAAQALAERHSLLFSMMPKPFEGQPGSGLHFHVSLWRDHPEGPTLADGVARHFIGGVLAHARALCALAAPTVNGYKRLGAATSISGTTWSPGAIAHGPNNRTAPVRTLPGRFEWRVPDASANVYLAVATLIAAGLDGIEHRLDPGPACTDDLYDTPHPELPRLPTSLDDALDALEADAVVAGALGPELLANFVALKREESLAWRAHVSDWERARYATAF
jgi:glutamine synthetase